ncbi:MAG: ferredoxin--NADP reductase [Saprospiraceae bacterium]
MEFYALKIKQITPETADTVTIDFDVPEALRSVFTYHQGQYITLRVQLDGHELRRSYSMSSSPQEQRLAVTVKKVQGGKVSGFLHDSIKVGDTLEIAPPDGRFYTPLDPEKRRSYYLFGAGSGITPLMSILKTVLEAEPMSTIFLLYGSRDEQNIIFRDALDRLSERYQGQLFVEHVLSRPAKESGGGLFGMFKKSTQNWQGRSGRIDARTVAEFLEENPPHGPETDCRYFLCGPGTFADAIKGFLNGRGVDPKQIHAEHFANAHHVPGENLAPSAAGSGKRLIVHLKGQRIETTAPENATILDVMVREKKDAPYSCTSGACATCMAKVLKGKVRMDVCYALEDDEIKAGYCLTCQAHPDSDEVELTYDF